jgi:hypothetical protein
MKLMIDKKEVNVIPSDIKNLNPTISLCRGRRFSFQSQDGTEFNHISLNSLISMIRDAALKKPKHDISEISEINEIKNFIEVFEDLKEKGYKDKQITQENFLTRIITLIKHFFAKFCRRKFLKELNQVTLIQNPKTNVNDQPLLETIPEDKKEKDEVTHDSKIETIQTQPKKRPYEGKFSNVRREFEKYFEDDDVENAKNVLETGIKFEKTMMTRYLIQLLAKADVSNNLNLEMVKLFLDFKADPNINWEDRVGRPIVWAALGGHLELMEIFFNNQEIKLDLCHCSRIFFYTFETKKAKDNYFDIFKCLIERGVDLSPDELLEASPLGKVILNWDKNPEKAKHIIEMMINRGARLCATERNLFIQENKIETACFELLKTYNIIF